jgi:hypothetical protein
MADLVIHAGDLVAASVLEELRGMGPVEAVHGNMDEAALRAELPAERVVEVDGVRIGLVHDAGAAQRREARLAARFPGCHVVVYGHTHLPQLARHGEVVVLNPGSPTERRRAPAHTMAELVIDSGQIHPELVTVST